MRIQPGIRNVNQRTHVFKITRILCCLHRLVKTLVAHLDLHYTGIRYTVSLCSSTRGACVPGTRVCGVHVPASGFAFTNRVPGTLEPGRTPLPR